MKFSFYTLLTPILFLVASGCRENEPRDFPLVSFEEYIYLDNPSSFDLQSVGGTITQLRGGYGGLIVTRRFMNGSQTDFAAYDLACPTHYNEDCATLEISEDQIFASCPCHGEKYLIFDGSPSDDAEISLVEYPTRFNGAVITVTN